MNFNYDPSLPTALDQVRFLIGDTDPTDPQLDDREVAFVLAESSGVVSRAALAACESLQARYARLVDTDVDSIKESPSVMLAQYTALVAQLRAKIARGGIRPLMGGQSRATKQADRQGSDLVQPAFTRDQFHERGLTTSELPR